MCAQSPVPCRVRAQSPAGPAHSTPSELQLQSHENVAITCNPNSFSLMIQQGPGEIGPHHTGSHSWDRVRRPPALVQHTLSLQQSPQGCSGTVPIGRKELTPTQRFLAKRQTRYPTACPLSTPQDCPMRQNQHRFQCRVEHEREEGHLQRPKPTQVGRELGQQMQDHLRSPSVTSHCFVQS